MFSSLKTSHLLYKLIDWFWHERTEGLKSVVYCKVMEYFSIIISSVECIFSYSKSGITCIAVKYFIYFNSFP